MERQLYVHSLIDIRKMRKTPKAAAKILVNGAKANAEIALGREVEALESTIKMIELFKDDDEYISRETLILLGMFNNSKYPEYDDLLLWFYEIAYGDEEYKEYYTWIEDYLNDSFKDTLK